MEEGQYETQHQYLRLQVHRAEARRDLRDGRNSFSSGWNLSYFERNHREGIYQQPQETEVRDLRRRELLQMHFARGRNPYPAEGDD